MLPSSRLALGLDTVHQSLSSETSASRVWRVWRARYLLSVAFVITGQQLTRAEQGASLSDDHVRGVDAVVNRWQAPYSAEPLSVSWPYDGQPLCYQQARSCQGDECARGHMALGAS